MVIELKNRLFEKAIPLLAIVVLITGASAFRLAPVYAQAGESLRIIVDASGGLPNLQDTKQPMSAILTAHRSATLNEIGEAGVRPSVLREFDGLVFNGFAMTIQRGELEQLKRKLGEERIFIDEQAYADLSQSTALIGANQVWSLTDAAGLNLTGKNVRVAIIDTGIDYLHSDLGACLGSTCKVVGGYDFVNEDADPMDDHGHGTHVAGIVSASGAANGVAPGARLLAYKVLSKDGSGWNSDIIAAIDRAVKDGAKIINLSLGGRGTPDSPISKAVDAAVANGVFVVVSAGNQGDQGFGTISAPGVARQAFTVGASDRTDHVAWFSSKGAVSGYTELNKPDLVAPGVGILSTYSKSGDTSGSAILSGTSMAAPHVAGAAALLFQLHPDWTPDMLRSALANSAKDIGALLVAQGSGRLSVLEAVRLPALAFPASAGFGLVQTSGEHTISIQIKNISAMALAVNSMPTRINRALVDSQTAVSPPESVSPGYLNTSPAVFGLAPGEERNITLTLEVPGEAVAGVYEGVIVVNISATSGVSTLRIPYSFWWSPIDAVPGPVTTPAPDPQPNPFQPPGNPLFLPVVKHY